MESRMRSMFGWVRRLLVGQGPRPDRARKRPDRTPSVCEGLERRQVLSGMAYLPVVLPPGDVALAANSGSVTTGATPALGSLPVAPASGQAYPAVTVSAAVGGMNVGGGMATTPVYSSGQPVIQATVAVRASAVAPIAYAANPAAPPTTTTPSPATMDSAYVQSLYHDVLNRPGNPDEVEGWVARMQGGMTVPTVARGFVNSIEHRLDEVDTYYQEFLNRTPDALASAWVNDLLAGASEESVAADILGSTEYQAAHPSNDQFVQGLYADVLGRQGNAQEVATWDAALASGTGRQAVVDDFINAPEAVDQVINGFYADYLHRTPEIATSDLWLKMLQAPNGSATDVAIDILSSDEFVADATRS